MHLSRKLFFVTSVFGALVSSTAAAQTVATQRIALDRFDPAERGSEWFVLDTLDMRGHLRPAIGADLDWGHNPLVLYDTQGNRTASIVSDQLFLHLGASLVLWDRLRVGFNFPIAIVDNGDGATLGGVRYPAPTSPAIGDLRLGADVRLVGEYRSPFTLAAGATLYAPTGNQDAYTGTGVARGVIPHVNVSGELGMFAYAGKLGIALGPAPTYANTKLGDEFQFGFAVGLRLADDKLLLGPEAYGSTVVEGGAFREAATPFELLFGAHYQFADDWRAGVGFGPGIARGDGEPLFRAVASIEWAPAFDRQADRDGDGVPDGDDACPSTSGGHDSDPSKNGCPTDDQSDKDKDKDNGDQSDQDKDGVPDKDDACPNKAGAHDADASKNGCPTGDQADQSGPDQDKDGVPDKEDACPKKAGAHDADPKKNGCPTGDQSDQSGPDQDKDGVPDAQDACPDKPGKTNPDPKANGCPRVRVEERQIKITEQIKFKSDSAEILPESDPVLNDIANTLKAHPEIKRVRVEGHTDANGDPAHNKELSRRRAEAVATWLSNHGVARSRLEAIGVGQDRPLDTNATEQGRRNNRRVEFHIVEGT